MTEQALQQVATAPTLIGKIAARYSVDPSKLMSTLKATAFKVKDGEATNEQMMALLIVADAYKLNPFTREIFAFPDRVGIVPVVSVDGWTRIINEHPAMNGIEFFDGPESESGTPHWIECIIYRKDREYPTRVRERFSEVRRDTAPWKSHPSRMLRHKTLIQCARIAFGFAGIYDEDEAERMINITGMSETVSRAPLRDQVKARQAMTEPTESPQEAVSSPSPTIDAGENDNAPSAPALGAGAPNAAYLDRLTLVKDAQDKDELKAIKELNDDGLDENQAKSVQIAITNKWKAFSTETTKKGAA